MTHLSDIFKYISKFRHAGHQVGRKVGDMLEVLTYAAISNNEALARRLQIEPKLFGFCDAGHKVEFALMRDPLPRLVKGGEIRSPINLIGFIECKKVGVEQTIHTAFKTKHSANGYTFSHNESLVVSMGRRGTLNTSYTVSFRFNQGELVAEVYCDGQQMLSEIAVTGHRVVFALTPSGPIVLGNEASLRDVPDDLLACKILEFQSVSPTTTKVLLNACLAGPQTPEKAKQASFVALDVRKLRFGNFDKRPRETEMVSVLVLTEFSHWEQKSQNVVTACLDKVVVVPDAIVVSAFERFEATFGAVFYDKISKDNFESNAQVRNIAQTLLAEHQGKIFQDLEDNVTKRFDLVDGSLALVA